ncbi:HAMP domain-containing protein, partial [Schumannella luteola]
HDFQLLLWIVGIAAVMSLGAAWLLARTARRAARALSDSARRLGEGDVVDAAPVAWREFAEVSTQLADASERLAAARAEIERLDASRRQF